MADAIASMFTAIISGLTEVPTALVGAIKTMFENFIYVDPSATTKSLSTISYFLLAMLGMSIGVGVVWLVISLFKRRA